jgi:hypothetical protein
VFSEGFHVVIAADYLYKPKTWRIDKGIEGNYKSFTVRQKIGGEGV